MNNKYKIVFKDGTEKVFNSMKELNFYLIHQDEETRKTVKVEEL